MATGKARSWWERTKAELAVWAPWLGIGAVGGMLVGGYVGAVENSRQIKRINRRLDRHSYLIDQHADAGNQLVAKCKEDHDRLEEMERKQNLLMEQALRVTEGRR